MSVIQTLRFIVSHPMNQGHLSNALYRFVKWQIRSRLRNEVIIEWLGGAKLAVRKGMTGATGNIYCGLHEYVDMRFVLDTLKPEDLFIDIGANVGSYTVLASKICGAKTIAFEPDPDAVRALLRNIEVNDIESRVQVIQCALGFKAGDIKFTVGHDTLNRVALPEDRNVQDVPIRRLEDVLSGASPTLIKIDVEGCEAEVLRGAGDILANPALKAVIIETRDETVLDILHEHGFKEAFYDPDTKKLGLSPKYHSSNGLMVRP
ncbi:FkbM family methyltransferase [Cereibacter sphaeroides]|uniref:FkbM family methyltransferase n=1 Tax=Cereibacter sphaeroides TaxID=1063 RepID=UPI003FCC7D98